jgi:hypothetical protein
MLCADVLNKLPGVHRPHGHGWSGCLLLALTLVLVEASGFAQVRGNLGEMDRLEQRAEEAMANGDPEGAALSIGKAAMMAAIIAKDEERQKSRSLYQAVETLFRGQEKGYRALALFERAGGQPPAANGVCQFLSHAAEMVKESRMGLKALVGINEESLTARRRRHLAKTREWEDLLQGVQQDVSCEREF